MKIKLMILLLLFQLILIFLFYDFTPFQGGDSISDLLLGRSLPHYTQIWLPDNPPDNWRQPAMPFIFALFGGNILLVKLFITALVLLSTVLIYQFFKNWAVVGLFIVSGVILEFAHLELTEIPYLFCVLLCFWLWEKGKYWWLAISLSCAYLIRVEAVALILAFAIYRRIGWRIVIPIAIVGLWTMRSFIIGNSQPSLSLFQKDIYRPELGNIGIADFIIRVADNFSYYFLKEGGLVLFNYSGFYLPLLLFILSFVGLISLARNWHTGRVILVFVILHYLILLAWQPSATHWRYALCLSPFLMLGLVVGMSKIKPFFRGQI